MAEELGVPVLPVALDLRKTQMIDDLYDLVVKEFDRVDILCPIPTAVQRLS